MAEAFNRLGMPDAAFLILKDGICEKISSTNDDGTYQIAYLSDDSRKKLADTYALTTTENLNNIFLNTQACGIHCHGAGKAASDLPSTNQTGGTAYHPEKSPYTFDRMVGLKMQEISSTFGSTVTVGTTKQDTINAIEDLICDEYALETAFEGNRYFDLMRLARHKNGQGSAQFTGSPAGYGSNFGFAWMKKKLGSRGWDESKMYLPFK